MTYPHAGTLFFTTLSVEQMNEAMEKRIFGIILTILGIAGLIAAAVSFANGGTDTKTVKMIVIYGILGAIFFFSGMGLIRSTKDVKSRTEEIS